MDFFEKLGTLVGERWSQAGYDEDAFPGIAEAALDELPPAKHVAIYEPLLEVASLRKRQDPGIAEIAFGEPPVRVFASPRFYIEVLYWLDGTTSIHEHSFNGAFHVMAGSSIHCRYHFVEQRRYNSQFKLGRVQRDQVEILRAGATRQILHSQKMTHSLFHLDRPSVSVVVRTYRVPGSDPQYNYRPPFIAYDPNSRHFSTDVVRAMKTLCEVGHPEWDHMAAELFRKADGHLFMILADDLISPSASQERVRAAMEVSRPERGELIDAVVAAQERAGRARGITRLRSTMRSSEQRFFLALLLHFSSGAELLDFVAREYPRDEPRDLVLRWIAECATSPDPDDSSRPVMSARFDEPMLDIMKPMLAGGTLPEVMKVVREEFDPDDVASEAANIATLRTSLREHPIFGPLFR